MTDKPLLGKRIAITGAGRGLGRALAIIAADQGADTVLLGRDPTALKDVAETIAKRSGRDSLVVACDLASAGSIVAACKAVLAENPIVDVLVNNGSPWLVGELQELSDEDISATIAATVTGTILVTKHLLPGLLKSNAADIMTVVSTAGSPKFEISGASVPFYAAKYGQSGFTARLQHELQDRDIRVNAIYPPDFDDVDPTDASWERAADEDTTLSNREIVATVLDALAAPRP